MSGNAGKKQLEHQRSEVFQKGEAILPSGYVAAPKMSLPVDLKPRAQTVNVSSNPSAVRDTASPVSGSAPAGNKLSPPPSGETPKTRRLSVSEGFSLRKGDPRHEMLIFLTVPEAEAKNVLEPLFWKVKMTSQTYSSPLSVTAKWIDWCSGTHTKETVRVSLWSKKDHHSTKLGGADVPLASCWSGVTFNQWVQLNAADGKPVDGTRVRIVCTTDSSLAASPRRLSVDGDELMTSTTVTLDRSSQNSSEVTETASMPSTPTMGRPPSRSVDVGGPSPKLAGLQLRRDTTALRQVLENRPAAALEREATWRKFFELPETDLLVGDWSGAFMKGVARHGRLFVFTDHLCFHSNLFGVKTMFTIPFVDVIGVEKTVENLTPGIKVRTSDKTYNFGGIYARLKCHEMISSVWKGSYVLVDETDQPSSDAVGGTAEEEAKLLEEHFPEELLSNKVYEKDGFLEAGAEELSELLQEDLPVTPTRFFQLFVSNESTFERDYHDARGDTDIKVGPWQPHGTFGTTRDVFYVLKLSGPIGPPTTRTEEVHRYHLQKDRLIIDTSMNMLDAPYGDYFRVESQWIISLNSDGASSHIKISAKAVFMKSTMMKGTISSRTLAGMTESFKLWISRARELIAKVRPASQSSPSKSGEAGSNNGAVTTPSTSMALQGQASSAGKTQSSVLGRIIGAGSEVAGGVIGILSSLLNRESLQQISQVLNVIIQVLLVYVLFKLINKL